MAQHFKHKKGQKRQANEQHGVFRHAFVQLVMINRLDQIGVDAVQLLNAAISAIGGAVFNRGQCGVQIIGKPIALPACVKSLRHDIARLRDCAAREFRVWPIARERHLCVFAQRHIADA